MVTTVMFGCLLEPASEPVCLTQSETAKSPHVCIMAFRSESVPRRNQLVVSEYKTDDALVSRSGNDLRERGKLPMKSAKSRSLSPRRHGSPELDTDRRKQLSPVPERVLGSGRAGKARADADSTVSFLAPMPKPHGQPHCRRNPVRVLVAAQGYIDASFSRGNGRNTGGPAATGRSPRSAPEREGDFISCTDNYVQLSTTYTDTKRFVFDKVYGSTDPTDGMFHQILPTVMDVANGINGHVIVSPA